MEDKGLRVNMDKTKILVCRAKPVQSRKPSGMCGVCGKRMKFQMWKMSKCSYSVEMSDSKAESATVGLEAVDTCCYLW